MNKENIIQSANYNIVAKYLWITPIQVKNYFNAPRVIKKNFDSPKDLREFIEKHEFAWSWIYCIENRKNWKKYVWKSINMYSRKRDHFNSLKKWKHKCKPLQKDYDIFWEEIFDFRVLEVVKDKAYLDEIEMQYMLRYSIDILYNIQFTHLLDFLNDEDLNFVKHCLSRKNEIKEFLELK